MKRLTCEMCGSIELIKTEGLFVCQTCGTKYSVEEAKKLMVEGAVEVTGSVKIDNSANFDRAFRNARRARNDNNEKLAAKYYEEVIDLDPDNWEAILQHIFCCDAKRN